MVEADVNAFAGADSISLTPPLSAQLLMLVLVMTHSSSALPPSGTIASSGTSFYGGTGADLICGRMLTNVTIYADSSAADTAGGADTISLASVTSATVYGAAGADTLTISGLVSASTIDGGTGAIDFDAVAVTGSTVIGGAGNDSFDFSAGVYNTSIVGGDGENTFTPVGAC